MKIDGQNLTGVSRCPHCQTANPVLAPLWRSDAVLTGALDSSKPGRLWAVYRCTTCGSCILARSLPAGMNNKNIVVKQAVDTLFPAPRSVDSTIPDSARKYLSQAHETLHAPDAAAVMAASAVDAMLKTLGYTSGSLYDRIDKAVDNHLLTDGMGKW